MSVSAVLVRAARMEDLGAVVAMERAAETAPHWAEAVYAGMLMEEPGGGGREHGVLVAEAGAVLVGFGVASIVRAAEMAEVENLVVVAEERRRGVGRVICERLIGWAAERGAAAMELEVRAGNVEARALYERLGFLEVGLRKGYYAAAAGRDGKDGAGNSWAGEGQGGEGQGGEGQGGEGQGGEGRGAKDGAGEDAVLMRLQLAAADVRQ